MNSEHYDTHCVQGHFTKVEGSRNRRDGVIYIYTIKNTNDCLQLHDDMYSLAEQEVRWR